MTPAWAEDARAALGAGPAAMVTVVATEGSAPRGSGTRMIVDAKGQRGTIGGGRLEQIATEQARAILSQPPATWRIQNYPLGPMLGQCCGGRVRLLVERLDPGAAQWLDHVAEGVVLTTRLGPKGPIRTTAGQTHHPAPAPASARGPDHETIVERLGGTRRPLYLFGAGHVGQAIARLIRPLPFTLGWFDAREEYAALEGVTYHTADQLAACALQAPADAAVVILTHDHGLDYDLTASALRGPAPFVGLIGSATKRARFISRLSKENIPTDRLTCPIGLTGIEGKEPEVIAVAVAAQLLMLDTHPLSSATSQRRSA